MKMALVADPHFGIKKSSKVFLDSQLRFFYDEFIPYLKEHDINDIIFLGDLFDTRNTLNIYMKSCVFNLFEIFDKEGFKIRIFPGNHDTYFKTTTEVHSLNFLKKFKNLTVYEDIELIELENKRLLYVPWQVNNENFSKRVANKNIHCDVCFGHFEIAGVPFNKTTISPRGIDTIVFHKNYTLTFSGHFHQRSITKGRGGEIIMVGSPFHLTRHDKGEDRGFCVLNLEDLSYEFVNSKKTIKFIDLKYPEEFNESIVKGNVIDISVDYDIGKTDDNEIQKYVNKIEKLGPAYPPNVFINHNLFSKDELEFEIKSVGELIEEYIENLNIDNKNEVKEIVNELYKNSKGEQI